MTASIDVVEQALPERRGSGDDVVADLGFTGDAPEHLLPQRDVVESGVGVRREIAELGDREPERRGELGNRRWDAALDEDPELVVVAAADRRAAHTGAATARAGPRRGRDPARARPARRPERAACSRG